LTPFLAAAATAVGALGWVTAVGGAIVWIHVTQAELPPAQAVARVPATVLIANGAEFLAIAFLASLFTVGALFLFDEFRLLSQGSRQAPKLEQLRQRVDPAKDAERTAERRLAASERVLEGAKAALAAAGHDLDRHSRAEEGAPDAELVGPAKNRVTEAEARLGRAEHDRSSAERSLETAREARTSAEAAFETEASLRKPAGLRIFATGLVLALVTFLFAVFVDYNGSALVDWGPDDLPARGWGAALVLSATGGLIGAFLFLRSASFPVLALFSFLLVPVVFAVVTYFRASEVPYVEPVALLRADGTPFVGFFLAETDTRVTVGTFKEATSAKLGGAASSVPARLLSLPADEVSELTVGSRLLLRPQQVDAAQDAREPRTAREWATETALLLCEDAAAARDRAEADRKAASASTDEPLPLECPASAVQQLTRDAQREWRVSE